jgi:hypothetical protein
VSDELRSAVTAELALYDLGKRDDPSLRTEDITDAVLAIPEIRRALAVLALVNGGPCETCGGKGWLVDENDMGRALQCDCIKGRRPGIIDRLTVIRRHEGQPGYVYTAALDAIIAALRKAVET